jgi:predicted PurR-regulated permease PerM
VSIHPLAVVVAISTGGVLAGIVGALLSVPTVAFFNNAFQVLLAKDPEAAAEETEDEGSIMQVEPDELESKSS